MMLCNGKISSQTTVAQTDSVGKSEVSFDGMLLEAISIQNDASNEGNLNTGELESNTESETKNDAGENVFTGEGSVLAENYNAATIVIDTEFNPTSSQSGDLSVSGDSNSREKDQKNSVFSVSVNTEAKNKAVSADLQQINSKQGSSFAADQKINQEQIKAQKAELVQVLQNEKNVFVASKSLENNRVSQTSSESIFSIEKTNLQAQAESAKLLTEVENVKRDVENINLSSDLVQEHSLSKTDNLKNDFSPKILNKNEYISGNALEKDINLRPRNVTVNSEVKTKDNWNKNFGFNNYNDKNTEKIIAKTNLKSGNALQGTTRILSNATVSGLKAELENADLTILENMEIRQANVSINSELNTISNDSESVESTQIKENIVALESAIRSEAKKGIDSEFTLKLKPEGLGEVTVELKHIGEHLEVLIKTRLTSTGELIAAEAKNLHASLNSEQTIDFHGVSVAVEYGFGETGNSMTQEHGNFTNESYQISTEYELASDEAEPIQHIVNRLRKGLIDYTA